MLLHRNQKIEQCVSKDKQRYMLAHPYIDKLDDDKGNIVATDGKQMVVIPVELEDGDASGYISCESIKRARANHTKSNSSELMAFGVNGSVVYQAKGGITTKDARPNTDSGGRNICNYPAYKQIIPHNRTGYDTVIGFDAGLLHSISQALGSRSLKVHIKDALSPLIVEAVDEVERPEGVKKPMGILMPVRIS